MLRSRSVGAETACTGSRKEPLCQLNDEQWQLISDLFPQPTSSPKGGRPMANTRACIEGILWVLVSGARWKDLPKHFPSPSTCWRRHAAWTRAGIWQRAWSRLLHLLQQRGELQLQEQMADGTFSSAKKGADAWAKPSVGKEPKSWFWPTGTVSQSAS